jgi:octaprenyl-diphosphate synthase
MDEIQAIIRATGALEYTAARAREAADAAIASLAGIPDSDYRQALISLAEFSVQRRS